jgi:carboxyl-terminal processing protease
MIHAVINFIINLRRFPRRGFGWFVGLLGLIGLASAGYLGAPLLASPQVQVFEQVWQTVNENFYTSNFNGVDWAALRQKYRPLVSQAADAQTAAEVINQMLAELKVSHTRFYRPEQIPYYQLLGIFQPKWEQLPPPMQRLFPNRRYEYTGIGAQTRELAGKVFVSGVLDGSPAQTAGVKVGDELLRVNGQPYQAIASFQGKAGKPLQLELQRQPPPASPLSLQIIPQVYDSTTMFVDAQNASTRVFADAQDPRIKLGYVHIWSNAADPNQQQLRTNLLSGKLSQADGLILDLRDGWGGGSTDYLNIFTGKSPGYTSISRDGRRYTYSPQWCKPVVMLVNQGSRSSKEIVAYGFKTLRIGPVVGSTTAGAVLGGRPYFMADGSMLYLAVTDVFVDGQQRLEGEGVSPDRSIPFELPYAQGTDPQFQYAKGVLSSLVGTERRFNMTPRDLTLPAPLCRM